MNAYRYRPVRYYGIVFLLTWACWIAAAFASRSPSGEGIGVTLMLLGLFVPSVTSIVTILTSKSPALKRDFREKIAGFYRIRPGNVLLSILIMVLVILLSIVLSLGVGESTDQFAFVGGFSFSIGGVPTLLTLVLTAALEEFGWRGYAEDSIANFCSWFKESMIFGVVWALWHLPLFFIPDTYQSNILAMNPIYMVNFFVSILPLGFLFTWVYVKNNRSIMGCMIFHFFVNFLQEQIAMTQTTKCIETLVLMVVAAVIVMTHRDMFFETRHVGRLLEGEGERRSPGGTVQRTAD